MSCVKVASMVSCSGPCFDITSGPLISGQPGHLATLFFSFIFAFCSTLLSITSDSRDSYKYSLQPNHPQALISPTYMSYSSRSQWSAAPRPSVSTLLTPPYASSSTAHPPRTSRGASEILPQLFISDLSFAENPACLASYSITHILSTLPDNILVPSESQLYPPPRRLQIRVEDSPFAELAAHLPTTTAWIRDAFRANPNARVLVHCVEGISRSVSVVAAFLIAQYGWTPVEAVQYIKSKRRVADPNFGFVQQLGEYRRSLGLQ